MQSRLVQAFRLIGGTSLSLQPGHRIPDDAIGTFRRELQVYCFTAIKNFSGRRLSMFQIWHRVLLASDTGKTLLVPDYAPTPLKKCYKAYFRTMEEILNTLKLKDDTRSAGTEYTRLAKANLIIIDNIMLLAVEKGQSVTFFNFINSIDGSTSFIITTNKAPAEWVTLLDDEVLATALLGQILYRCELLQLPGKSYGLRNRKPIFES